MSSESDTSVGCHNIRVHLKFAHGVDTDVLTGGHTVDRCATLESRQTIHDGQVALLVENIDVAAGSGSETTGCDLNGIGVGRSGEIGVSDACSRCHHYVTGEVSGTVFRLDIAVGPVTVGHASVGRLDTDCSASGTTLSPNQTSLGSCGVAQDDTLIGSKCHVVTGGDVGVHVERTGSHVDANIFYRSDAIHFVSILEGEEVLNNVEVTGHVLNINASGGASCGGQVGGVHFHFNRSGVVADTVDRIQNHIGSNQ